MGDFTATELQTMTQTELELAAMAAGYTDPATADARFGTLPYDDVLDANGTPMRRT